MREVSPPPTKRRRTAGEADWMNPKRCLKGELQSSQEAPVDANTIRIYSWNINGIGPFLQKSITPFFSSKPKPSSSCRSGSESALDPSHYQHGTSLREFLRRHHWPHILCLQEVKIASMDTSTQAAVKRAVNDSPDGPKYDVFFTLPTDRFNARGWGGRVYGVSTIIRKDVHEAHVACVRTVDWDHEGRVSVVELHGGLHVWNVYAVNGTDNAWRDPESGAVVGTRHDKKLLVQRKIVEDCVEAERSGCRVLIVGDLNVAPENVDGYPNLRTFPEQHVVNRSDFNARFFRDQGGLRAVDVWRSLKGDEKRYTYFPRGRPWGSSCDRVDLIIASRSLTDQVVDVEIFDSDEERGPSDHVPLAVEIRLSSEQTKCKKTE